MAWERMSISEVKFISCIYDLCNLDLWPIDLKTVWNVELVMSNIQTKFKKDIPRSEHFRDKVAFLFLWPLWPWPLTNLPEKFVKLVELIMHNVHMKFERYPKEWAFYMLSNSVLYKWPMWPWPLIYWFENDTKCRYYHFQHTYEVWERKTKGCAF